MANNTSPHILSTAATSLLFLSLFIRVNRTKDPVKERRLESFADILFFSSLIGIVIIILLPVFHFIR